jgi:hypothetical protein
MEHKVNPTGQFRMSNKITNQNTVQGHDSHLWNVSAATAFPTYFGISLFIVSPAWGKITPHVVSIQKIIANGMH